MINRITNFCLLATFFLTACSVKVSDNPVVPPVAPAKLQLSAEPLSGTMNGGPWTPLYAIARKTFSADEYSVTLAGVGDAVTCDNWFPRQAHVSFSVPLTPGTFSWDMANPVSGARIVNVVFPYTTGNGGGATTVLAEASVIRVDSLDGGYLKGAVAAVSASAEHPYNLNGVFAAQICP